MAAQDDRSRFLVVDQQSIAAQMQQQQLAALQQQQLQKQLLAQQMLAIPGLQLPAAGGVSGTQAETAARKAREIYIGNLAIGVITPDLLREFFDQVCRLGAGGPAGQSPPPCLRARGTARV